jgi:hypothetical protein
MRLNLLGGTYLARSLIADAQTCLNLYAEKNPQDASAPFTNLLTPGLTLKATAPSPTIGRGLYTATTGNLYCVIGYNVYFIDNNFIFHLLGTMNALASMGLTTPVNMQDNGDVLIIVDGSTAGYAVNLQTGINGMPLAFVLTNAGNSGVQGTYSNVPLTGGSGMGATAQIEIGGAGTIISLSFGTTGTGYIVGDVLGIRRSGNTGYVTGVQITVTAVGGQVNAFAQITDPNFLGSVGIGIVDTFMGFNQPQTRNFYTTLSEVTYESITGTASGQPSIGSIINGGAVSANGSYTSIALVGGSGNGATANLTVSGGVITVVTLLPTGTGYVAGDLVSVINVNLDTQFSYEFVQVNPAGFDATFIVSKFGYPDLLSTVINVHREFWLMGASESTEIWYDSGGGTLGSGIAAFPFSIIPGVFLQHGCAAPYSVQTYDLFTFWLSVDDAGIGTVFQGAGYEARRVSTFSIEKIISFALVNSGTISDAIGMIYKQQDHVFYVLTFPTADITIVYDATENLWHERGWTDPSTGLLHRVRYAACTLAYSLNLALDWQTGALYALDLNNFTDNNNPIVRRRAFAHILNDGKRASFDRFALDMECGDGVATNPTYKPQLTLEISDDRGRTFTQIEAQSMGAQGQYLTQMIWHRLGLARDRVFRVTWSEPVFTAIQGAWIDMTPAET